MARPYIARPLEAARYLRDAFQTFDQATMDSAGAFLVGELERLDPMIHEPLVSTTWSRDIDLRTDVQMGDTSSSYTVSSFGGGGGVTPSGINWASTEQTASPRVSVDIGKIPSPLGLWSGEVAYTIPELESARITGRPIDTQMVSVLNLKHQMDVDQMVYVGDATINLTGLANSAQVSNVSNVANGASASATWASKTPDEILKDVNELLISVWSASGYAVPPTKLLIAPVPFGLIATRVISAAGNQTVLAFLETNNILTAEKGIKLEIKSVKWLDKAVRPGATTDRMIAYTQRPDYVRYPLVPLQAAPQQFRGIWIVVPYYGRLGVVETVYPETIGYRDGIG
ncbi:DUF2184 domain-containing protein [Salinarimonas soli]|uniref:DUF2184 domain-containing protein n=1 Tax=Salinarimonas soli TaxID=1638099 RepID=A0A5B2VH31_9HYPH|nr:DUF2184 domain-containing protein [Salinarimonas soli]